MTNGRNYCPSLGEGHKGADICYRCSEMNGDSPCNQGREGVPGVETARAKAPRHGGGVGRECLEVGLCPHWMQLDRRLWAPLRARPSPDC